MELWLAWLTVKLVVVFELELTLAAGVVAWLVGVEIASWLDTVVVLVAWDSLLAEVMLTEVACELTELVVAVCCGAFSPLWTIESFERRACTLLVVLTLVAAAVTFAVFSVWTLLAPVVSACTEKPTVPKVVNKVTPEAKYNCFNFCFLYFLTNCFFLVFFIIFLSILQFPS